MKPTKRDQQCVFHALPSHIVSGAGLVNVVGGPSTSGSLALDEVKKIHDENVAKLSALSKDEILEEQSRIRASLGKLLPRN